jgi:hypothetical protein
MNTNPQDLPAVVPPTPCPSGATRRPPGDHGKGDRRHG